MSDEYVGRISRRICWTIFLSNNLAHLCSETLFFVFSSCFPTRNDLNLDTLMGPSGGTVLIRVSWSSAKYAEVGRAPSPRPVDSRRPHGGGGGPWRFGRSPDPLQGPKPQGSQAVAPNRKPSSPNPEQGPQEPQEGPQTGGPKGRAIRAKMGRLVSIACCRLLVD